MRESVLAVHPDLEKFRSALPKSSFASLIGRTMKLTAASDRIAEVQKANESFTLAQRNILFELVDRWNALVYEKKFWKLSTVEVFDHIVTEAANEYERCHVQFDGATLSSCFRSFVLTCAHNAADQPNMREFMGLRTPRPFTISGLVLGCLIVEALFAVVVKGESYWAALRTGFRHLAIALVISGLWAGTFRVFAIRSRIELFLLAAVLIGILLRYN